MRQIAERPERVADPHDRRRPAGRAGQGAMDDDAGGALAHRRADEAMGIVALAFEGDENRIAFDLLGIGHNLPVARELTGPGNFATGRREYFRQSPSHAWQT